MSRLQTGYLSEAGFLGQNLKRYKGLSTYTGEWMATSREQEEIIAELDITNIPSGIYLLSVEQEGNIIFLGKYSIIKN